MLCRETIEIQDSVDSQAHFSIDPGTWQTKISNQLSTFKTKNSNLEKFMEGRRSVALFLYNVERR